MIQASKGCERKAFWGALIVSIIVLGFTLTVYDGKVPDVKSFEDMGLNFSFPHLLDFIFFFPVFYLFFYSLFFNDKSILTTFGLGGKSNFCWRDRRRLDRYTSVFIFVLVGVFAVISALTFSTIFPLDYFDASLKGILGSGFLGLVVVHFVIAFVIYLYSKAFFAFSFLGMFFLVFINSIQANMGVFLYGFSMLLWFLSILLLINGVITRKMLEKAKKAQK